LATVPDAQYQDRLARVLGKARTGTVSLRDFDQGVVETLGAVAGADAYYLTIPGVDPPPKMPGLPVVYSFPEDTQIHHFIPSLLVRRDTMDPAMQRWHPGSGQYRAPGDGALPRKIAMPGGVVVQGYDRYEELAQAIPFDFGYTIQIYARHRGAPGQKNQANAFSTTY
jgi:hypothetical protein